jgi:3-hydroxyacyl-CoA dehydrogenase/enoyl-CoA hydratase/3-hydroxybutyryl-CoA epimerase
MAVRAEYGDWQVTVDEKAVAWVWFDKKDSRANTLNSKNLADLDQLITDLSTAQVKAMVLQSAKDSGFIAGADIHLFTLAASDPHAVQALIEGGQLIFTRLEQAPFFTLAVIEGFCVGGGLELVLACKARIAVNSEKTQLSLPEVTLGVVPGWGGSVRLARRIGCWEALKMVVSGKSVDAKRAAQLGLVNVTVEKRHVNAAIESLLIAQPSLKPSRWWSFVWRWPLLRTAALSIMKQSLSKKINPIHYPAPFQVIENWKKTNVLTGHQAYRDEVQTFMRLVSSETAQNLVHIFFLQERFKSTKGNKAAHIDALHVHVIGAGRMGGDIAAWLALKGSTVTVFDENPDRVAIVLQEAQKLFARKLKNPYAIQAATDRLMPGRLYEGIAKADLVIEAVIEDKDVKQAVLQSIEPLLKPSAIIATNTSTIPLESLATTLRDPSRLIGLHFFNPVPLMPLVEVIGGEKTDRDLINTAITWVKYWGKIPIVVKSASGFLVNRILMPYLMESIALLEEGFSVETVDDVAVAAGFPMGPFTLMDIIGLDVCAMVVKNLMPEASLPDTLKRLVETGALGKKTHRGFYAYNRGNPVLVKRNSAIHAPPDIIDRLWGRLWVAANAVLREGVVEDSDTVDAGLLFGAGFPAFQGGLLHHIHQHEAAFSQKQAALVTRYGDRFSLSD